MHNDALCPLVRPESMFVIVEKMTRNNIPDLQGVYLTHPLTSTSQFLALLCMPLFCYPQAVRPAYRFGWVISRVLHSYCNFDQLPLSTRMSRANLWGLVGTCYGGCCPDDHIFAGKGRKI